LYDDADVYHCVDPTPIPVDTQPPTVLCGTADGLWHSANVGIACTASDAGAGLADAADAAFTLSTGVAAGTESNNAQTGARTVCDAASNCVTVGPIEGNKVDRRQPSIALAAPVSGAYLLNQPAVAKFACTDAGAGVATCLGPVADGVAFDTSSAGQHTFSVTATDAAGNVASTQVAYVVGASTVNPPDGVWTALSSMPTARVGLASATSGGRVYAIGGASRTFDFHSIGAYAVNAVDAYDPATNTWTSMAPLPFARVYPNGATSIDGRIYLPGGKGCDITSCREGSTLFIFDPSAGPQGAWSVGPPMPAVLTGGTSAAIGGQLYVLAGWSVGAPRNYLFRLDPLTGIWTQLTGSPRGHTFGASASVGGKLYAFGGEGAATALDIYDPDAGWTSKTMPVGYQHHAAVTVGGLVYLVGGQQFINGVYVSTRTVMAYDPQTETWTTPVPVPSAHGPYAGHAGASLTFAGSSSSTLPRLPVSLDLPAGSSAGGGLYVMGGTDAVNPSALPSAFVLSPPSVDALTYQWDFGDGQQGSGSNPAHVYATPGTYTVTLSVSTPDGRVGSTTTVAMIEASRTQAITFTSTAPGPGVVGATYTVAATGGASGNPVVFSSLTSAVCTVGEGGVTLTAAGFCTVAANQAGTASYDAAPQVTQSFMVTPPPIPAASLQRWRVNSNFSTLAVFGDGTLLAANGATGGKINARTGADLGAFPADARMAIRLSTGDQDYAVGGYQGRNAYRQDGSLARSLMAYLGCCNIPHYPMAIDPVRDQAYVQANGELFGANMSTGGLDHHFYNAGDRFGMISLADSDTLYTAGQNGTVTRLHPVNGKQWQVSIDAGALQPGAVAADGSFVVSSRGVHLGLAVQPGRMARVLPNGTVAWNLLINAVTPPVIGANGLVYVGTQVSPITETGDGAIEAYDLAGNLVWRTAVSGLPNDLLVGDDEAVYAGTGVSPAARVYVLAQTDGLIRKTITSLPAAWEIILRGGLLYATGGTVTALPVDAVDYDPDSPWPVRFHDNQRTANRQAPLLTAPPQSIAFTSLPPNPAVVGGTYDVAATGGASGNPVAFSTLTPATCTVNNSRVSFVGAGTCVIAADQAASAGYDAASQVTQTFGVIAPPVIDPFPQAGWQLVVTVTSGATVVADVPINNAGGGVLSNMSISAPVNCYNGGDRPWVTATFTEGVTPVIMHLRVSVPAGYPAGLDDACYSLRADGAQARTYGVRVSVQPPAPLAQSIVFTSEPPNPAVAGGTYEVMATGGASGNPITFSSLTPVTCSVSGGNISLLAAGHCAIAANQAAGSGYADAPQAIQSFAVWLSGTTTPQISAGSGFTCALNAEGTVSCWGSNSSGQATVPVGLASVTGLSAGANNACVVKSDGAVACWGSNFLGISTVPAELPSVAQVSAGAHVCVVTVEGAVNCWGNNISGQTIVPAGLASVVQVSAAGSHTCALKADGTVVCWGRNVDGQTSVPTGFPMVAQVAAGSAHTCAVTRGGTVTCWGSNNYGQLDVPAGLSGVAQVTTGFLHVCALKTDGTVVCWGNNISGQATVPAGLTSVAQVSAGGHHVCALRFEGSVVCWGNNNFGQAAPPVGLDLVADLAQTIAFTSSPPNPALWGTTYTVTAAGGARAIQ
jgi:alpha-tubulin suppressor-like RCC1 family protein/PKD repeat protein